MKKFKNIYCVIKQSGFEYFQTTQELKDRFQKLSEKRKNQLIESHRIQGNFIHLFQEKAEKVGFSNIEYVPVKDKSSIQVTDDDLVVSCGGDGTFLICAQDFQNNYLLGVNSHYSKDRKRGSVGALTSINEHNLESKLEKLYNGEFKIDFWNRLQVKINGEPIPRYAVNDIFIGPRISYETSSLTIRKRNQEEDFQCSGMIVCTGMGSHAWFYNAGGSPFSNELNAFGYMVLIPNIKRPLKFTSGVLSERNELEIILHQDNNVLSFDSKHNVLEPLMGDSITVGIAKDHPVKVLQV